MKKAILVALVSVVLSGCSYKSLLPSAPAAVTATATATATRTLAPTQTATIVPTQPTATFTGTPTLIYPNGSPVPSATATPPATLYVLPSTTETFSIQAPQGNGPFTSILVSGRLLNWGSCEPSSIKLTVKVSDGVPATTVLIPLRLEDTKTHDTTPWGGNAIMDNLGGGVFTYTLRAESFSRYHDYLQAWGQYQFVAFDIHLNRLGASTQYLNSLTLAPCR